MLLYMYCMQLLIIYIITFLYFNCLKWKFGFESMIQKRTIFFKTSIKPLLNYINVLFHIKKIKLVFWLQRTVIGNELKQF